MATTGAILLRVSTKAQADEDAETYKFQLMQCRDYAVARGITVPEDLIWDEIGSRGNYYTRDGLQKALVAADQHRYQALIVWRLDRLTDDFGHFMKILDRLKKGGALPWSATEPDVDLSVEHGLWYVHTKLHYQVAPERKTIKIRTQAARREKIEGGRPWASNRPRYGYRWVVDWSRTKKRGDYEVPLKERLEEDPQTALVVRQMYDWMDAGKTLGWITRALSGLEDGGIYKKPTPRQYAGVAGANEDGEWSDGSISALLEFPGYMGKWPAYRTKREPRDDESERSRQKPQDEDQWVWVEPDGPGSSPAPALVSPAQWHRVQRRLTANKENSKRNRRDDNPLEHGLLHTGMARCGRCLQEGRGGRMYARPRPHADDLPDGTRVYAYECMASHQRFPKCRGVYSLTEPLDRAVQLALYHVLRHPDLIAKLARRSQDEDRARAEGITVITPVDEYNALQKSLDEIKRKALRAAEQSSEYDKDDARGYGFRVAAEVEGARVAAKAAEVEQARRKAEQYQRVERTIGEWMDYLEAAEDHIADLGDPNLLSYPRYRRMHRWWLELLGAKVIVPPYDTVKAGGPLATLRLHLTALGSHGTLNGSSHEEATDAVEVPVIPAPEPVWRRAGYVEPVEPTPPTAEEIAAEDQAWAEFETRQAVLRTPESIAAAVGCSLEEAREYVAWHAALEADQAARMAEEECDAHTPLGPHADIRRRLFQAYFQHGPDRPGGLNSGPAEPRSLR